MLPIATEVFTVTEQSPGQFVSVLNDEFFAARKVRDPNRYLKAMILMGRDQVLREIATTDRTQTVDIAVHKGFRSSVFSASFLLDEEMKPILLTYFGEQTDPTTYYTQALVHVLEVLDLLENDLAGAPSLPRSKGTQGKALHGQ